MNRWRIPPDLETAIRQRDAASVYCGISFATPSATRGRRPSWEHIVNDERIITLANIALCCISCNASKGARELHVWLGGRYCARKGITRNSIAAVARAHLDGTTDRAVRSDSS